MRWPSRIWLDPWQIAFAAVAGLLLAVILGGVAGLTLNEKVVEVAEKALLYDTQLEDIGDELRVAVLDLRHYHRNIAFSGPSRGSVADFDRAYLVLLEKLQALEEIGLRDPKVPVTSTIRANVEAYYADFRPAVELYDADQVAFTRASENGLSRLSGLTGIAETIDRLGEHYAQVSLQQVEGAARTARLILLAEFVGFGLIGLGLAYAAVRVLRELRHLHAREQATSDALAQVSQTKTEFMAEFIADVSHELRTPLTVLRGNAEVGLQLQRDCGHESTLREIVRETESMARLVEDLLLLARSEGTMPPLDLEIVEVEPLLREVAERAAILARERGATLQIELTGDGSVRIDRPRIEQTVLILVDNAAKEARTGVPLTLACSTDPDELHLEVSDHQHGLAWTGQDQAFDQSLLVERQTGRRTIMMGLGLSIAKTIVEAHGGRLETARRQGGCTRLLVHLPRWSRSDADPSGASLTPVTADRSAGGPEPADPSTPVHGR